MRRMAVLCMLCLLVGTPASAQEPYNLLAPVDKLATMFTDLFGPRGLIVDSEATLPGEQPHSAHFASDFQSNFSQFSTALVGQLVSVPLPAPSSGFTYEFDASLGIFQRTTQSFGPILAARADTVGARRISIGFAYQRFTFDTVEGLDLTRVPAVFTHDNAQLLGGRQDVVSTINRIEASVAQATTFVTVGVTDRLDVSLAVPIVSTSLSLTSEATIERLGTTNELTHFFRQSDGEVGSTRIFSAIGRAEGMGDLLIRVKNNVRRTPTSSVAVGLDMRLPTGDEANLLGSGAAGLQPFAIWSGAFDRVAPHANIGYTWNGASVLAGDPATGESAGFPDHVSYALGADVGVNPRLTVAFDIIGRYMLDAERVRTQDFHALDGTSVFPNIVFARDSFNESSGAIGLKANAFGQLLIDVNLLFRLDNNGLRDKVTPLIGIEYSF